MQQFPLSAFAEFLRRFSDKIWNVFKQGGIVVEERFPAAFLRSVLHTCIRFYFVQGMGAPDPSKLVTLPHVTFCEKQLRRRIQFVSYITQDQFRRFPDWLTNEANIARKTPTSRGLRYAQALTPSSFSRQQKRAEAFTGRSFGTRLSRAKSQGEYESISSTSFTSSFMANPRNQFKPRSGPGPKPFRRPMRRKFQSSWSKTFRESKEQRRQPLQSHGRWLKHFDPSPSNDALDGLDSIDIDGISVLSMLDSDTESVTSAKSDSCILAMRRNRQSANVLEPQCHSDESITISRPATRPQSRQVSQSNLIDWADTYMKWGSSDTYESLHQVYKFVSEMEGGLFRKYATILLKNRISWNILSCCEIEDLTQLGIPRIHARFLKQQIRLLVVE